MDLDTGTWMPCLEVANRTRKMSRMSVSQFSHPNTQTTEVKSLKTGKLYQFQVAGGSSSVSRVTSRQSSSCSTIGTSFLPPPHVYSNAASSEVPLSDLGLPSINPLSRHSDTPHSLIPNICNLVTLV